MKTAQLPKVEMSIPEHVIGRNTSNAIQSGLLYGYCGLVDGMVHRIADELGMPLQQIKVIATGGLAELIYANSETIQEVNLSVKMRNQNMVNPLHTPTAQMQRHLRTFSTIYQNAAAIFPQQKRCQKSVRQWQHHLKYIAMM